MNREATGLAGARHIPYDHLGSTNAEALTLARAGESGPLWITAKTQSAGRGRRGTAWVSEPGNLYATLLLSGLPRIDVAPQLSFVAALAVYDALTSSAPRLDVPVALKWPNDALIGGRKAAGILIEGDSGPPQVIVAGFGINCASHPVTTGYPATDLRAEGVSISAEALFAALSRSMARRYAQWNGGEGFASIRADWLARAAGLGEAIRVRLPDRELAGRFEGLDDAGCLILAGDGRREIITAGEVFAMASQVAS